MGREQKGSKGPEISYSVLIPLSVVQQTCFPAHTPSHVCRCRPKQGLSSGQANMKAEQ